MFICIVFLFITFMCVSYVDDTLELKKYLTSNK